MKNEIIKFDYESIEIRTLTDETEETWFVAKDVCEILEYSNVSQTMDKMDDDEKLLYKIHISGQQKETWTINESGLYHLILTSTKPEAKKFRKWVTSVVLPSIRKAGKYTTKVGQQRELELQQLMNEVEEIENSISKLKSDINDLKDKKDEKYARIKQIIKTDPNQTSISFPE